MSIERMTTAEYAGKRGIGASAVRKAIKMGHKLPGVEKHEKFGRDHVLYVDTKKLKKILVGIVKVT